MRRIFFPDNFEPSSVSFHAGVVFGLGPNFLFKNLCEDFKPDEILSKHTCVQSHSTQS